MGLFKLFAPKRKTLQKNEPSKPTPNCEPEFGDSFGKCGNAARWKYDETNNTFTISGEGSIEQFENINDYQRRTIYDPHNLGPWYEKPDFHHSSIPGAVIKITIPEGITSIESMAFWRFKNLKTIILPRSIEHISQDAFLHTEQLTFFVQKDSYAESIVDSLGFKKSYYSN